MRVDRRFIRGALTVAGVLIAIVATLPLTLPRSLHTRLTTALGEQFGGSVEIERLRVAVFPRIRVSADAVIVRRRSGSDAPPFITIKSVSAAAGLYGLTSDPIRLRSVYLEGLEINIPPDKGDDKQNDESVDAAPHEKRDRKSPIVIDEIVSERATLRILRSAPGKRPREFAIERLSMKDTGDDVPWAFAATLTNPTPPGKIATHGTFGPWNMNEPGQTPLAAQYEFRNADLGTFDGIRGTLQSTGHFSGVLEHIEADGTTDVPDFALAAAGHPVHLKTTFHSVIDGTNGNTWLQPVVGTFRNTTVHASGGVVEREGQDGRTVTLDIVMNEARIEDVLYLATKAKTPAMTGALKLTAKFELPPGHVDPEIKMRLTDGTFAIATAHFPSGGVQARVNELSQKARADDGAVEEVASDLTGRFEMKDGTIHFSRITFAIPGARVDLVGTYAVKPQTLDFDGTVRMDAKLSQLTQGPKAFLLKLAEPIFRRNHMTVIPITLKGTVEQPKFGLDIGRAFSGK